MQYIGDAEFDSQYCRLHVRALDLVDKPSWYYLFVMHVSNISDKTETEMRLIDFQFDIFFRNRYYLCSGIMIVSK